MLFTTVLSVCLIPFVAAQYGAPEYGTTTSTSASGSSTSTSPAAAPSAPSSATGQININVAPGGQIKYNPANITAPNGTVVTFFFPPASLKHSVSQSSFAAPCTYLAATSSTPAGFDSGLTAGTQFTITITNDAEPIWFHCKQVGHCGMGMVGSINAPASGNTYDAFVAAALAIGGNEVTETDHGAVTGGVDAQATASPANTFSSSASSSAASATTTGKSSGTVRHHAGVGAILLAVAVVLSFA